MQKRCGECDEKKDLYASDLGILVMIICRQDGMVKSAGSFCDKERRKK